MGDREAGVIDEPRTAFPRERVRTSWQILIGSALFKAAFLAWQMGAASCGGGGYGLPAVSAYGTPDGPQATPLGPDLPGLLGLAAMAALAEGCYGIVVAAWQRRVLRRAPPSVGGMPRLRGWTLGSGAAATLAAAPGWFAFILLNHIADGPVDPFAVLALLGGTAIEVGAIAAVQRRWLARAGK
jgi:hypothetical protein